RVCVEPDAHRGNREQHYISPERRAIGPECRLNRPLRQGCRPASGGEGGHDRVEEVPARVPAASTRSQVNIDPANQ
ncbi:MAG TPA: hypothetical protein VFY18_09245, partial [Candidatus Limnocylindrales bacterium]|nr:hypothetical protein [Candidatus Limnocylindrales bacterium]